MKADFAEFLFNPVERMVVVRPCKEGHPNAFSWNRPEIGTVSLAKILYNSMGWDTEYTFKIPCQTLCNPSNQGEVVLIFDLDNYIGQTAAKKEEAIPSPHCPSGIAGGTESEYRRIILCILAGIHISV